MPDAIGWHDRSTTHDTATGPAVAPRSHPATTRDPAREADPRLGQRPGAPAEERPHRGRAARPAVHRGPRAHRARLHAGRRAARARARSPRFGRCSSAQMRPPAHGSCRPGPAADLRAAGSPEPRDVRVRTGRGRRASSRPSKPAVETASAAGHRSRGSLGDHRGADDDRERAHRVALERADVLARQRDEHHRDRVDRVRRGQPARRGDHERGSRSAPRGRARPPRDGRRAASWRNDSTRLEIGSTKPPRKPVHLLDRNGSSQSPYTSADHARNTPSPTHGSEHGGRRRDRSRLLRAVPRPSAASINAGSARSTPGGRRERGERAEQRRPPPALARAGRGRRPPTAPSASPPSTPSTSMYICGSSAPNHTDRRASAGSLGLAHHHAVEQPAEDQRRDVGDEEQPDVVVTDEHRPDAAPEQRVEREEAHVPERRALVAELRDLAVVPRRPTRRARAPAHPGAPPVADLVERCSARARARRRRRPGRRARGRPPARDPLRRSAGAPLSVVESDDTHVLEDTGVGRDERLARAAGRARARRGCVSHLQVERAGSRST